MKFRKLGPIDFLLTRKFDQFCINYALGRVTDGKPHIILGRDLIDFLKARKARNRIKLGPGEFYCFGCKVARSPAGGLVEVLPGGSGPANLRALCQVCDRLMHRRVTRARISEICAGLDVSP